VLAGVSSAAVSLPVLPPPALGLVTAINAEQGEQVGWRELAEATAEVWSRSKPPVVFTQNYGQAGAIAHYGPGLGLPAPYSGHMSFHDWGPPPDAPGPVLVVRQKGDGPGALGPYFTGCVLAATFDNGFGLDNEEQGAELWTCAGTTRPWSAMWPELRRHY
ncbi:MAG TPA: hypothetical protein VGF17_07735, partial [Phytomonospora sp.]